ncbi:hypothetical protein [Zhongshania marina]|uniref:Fenitrothion hydrolase FedB n=1 Tax=Zhongshania marina TaxID=2304603 RepID=A0ABX9W3J7_9GAMM|nr:hypothetical protein D0911_08270 [Zhongshania marina]
MNQCTSKRAPYATQSKPALCVNAQSMPRLIKYLGLIALSLLYCNASYGHSFGQTYTLPVPLSLYLYGSAAALAVSFLVFGYFLRADNLQANSSIRLNIPNALISALRSAKPWVQGFSVFMLLLCIATGLFGNRNPYGNFNMTFFWVIFVLAYAYFCALTGNSYQWLNPWKILSDGIGRFYKPYQQGLFNWPARLNYWPATILYMVFIWLELFGTATPLSLSKYLLAYTVLNLLAAGLVGIRNWYKYGELFSVLLMLLSKMSFVCRRTAKENTEPSAVIQSPFIRLNRSAPSELSLLAFILCMLASTAFDGLHESQLWIRTFWVDLNPYFQPYVGTNPFSAYPKLRTLYLIYQTMCLVLLPLIYFLIYYGFIALSKYIVNSSFTSKQLALHFAYSLLPIVLAYHLSHYYPLVQTQGIKIISLASDPFGIGMNIFATAEWFRAPIIPNVETVWHAQLGLIVLGHIMSVYIAHRQALALFGSKRQAMLSQIPMLILMIAFTVAGLWILSLPMGNPS